MTVITKCTFLQSSRLYIFYVLNVKKVVLSLFTHSKIQKLDRT